MPLRLALVGPISRPKYLTPEIEAMRAVFANASPSGSLIKPAPDGAIQAQAPHAALLPSRRLKSTRPIAVGRRRTGRLFEQWPVLRPSRTFKRRQPAARPRILHTRRHDRDERARCRALVRAACEGRLWPQQVHQMDVKAAVGVLSWGEPETAAEEPSAVASQRLPGSPGGSPCPF